MSIRLGFRYVEIESLRLDIYVDFFKPSQQFTASGKRRFLIRSRVLETRDAIFLKTFKCCLIYYIEPPHTTTLQIPSFECTHLEFLHALSHTTLTLYPPKYGVSTC